MTSRSASSISSSVSSAMSSPNPRIKSGRVSIAPGRLGTIPRGWWRTSVSAGPLVSEVELRRVMVSDPRIADGPKGLKAPSGLYTGGTNDGGGLESERLCPCRVCWARPGNLGPKPGEGESAGSWGETERPGVGDAPCCCNLLSLKRRSCGSAGDEI